MSTVSLYIDHYSYNIDFRKNISISQGNRWGQFRLLDVQCDGTESNIWNCHHSQWEIYNYNDCSGAVNIDCHNGRYNTRTRVELELSKNNDANTLY